MNKTVRKKVELIRDIILIFSIPTLFGYLYILHQEQLQLKENTIELLEHEQERLRNNQIENVTQRYDAIEKFYGEESRILKDSVNIQKGMISDYERLLNDRKSDSNSITIPFEMAREILIDLTEKDHLEEILKLYNERDSIRLLMIERYEKVILALLDERKSKNIIN